MNDSRGFIKLFRSMLDWEWFTDPNLCHFFIYCILKANFQDKRWQGKTIERGSFVTSYNVICMETGLSKQNIKTALNKLTQYLTHKSTNRNTIISIKNYDMYSGGNTNSNPRANPPLTTTKNDKKNKKIIESLSDIQKITDQERELLKKYLLRQKRKPDNLNAYISVLIRNGDWKEIVEKEKLRQKRISQTQKTFTPAEQFVNSKEDEEKIKEMQKKIAQMFKDKGLHR